MVQVTAKLNYLRIAPRKVRLVSDALKGLSINEAEAQLLFRPRRPSEPLLKLLRSAVANAKNNHKLKPENLVVRNIRVDQGPMLKRFLPRAMGRATPIQKKSSHVFLVLEEKSNARPPRFNIAVAKKIKSKKSEIEKKSGKAVKPKENNRQLAKPTEKAGFFKRFFRRKSV